MNTPQYIPSFYFYKFAQGISAPYTELAAYSAGAIDSSGNVLKAESSIDSFEYLIIKLKKIFEQLPAGLTKAQLTNYLSTLQLFGESVQAYDISDAQFAGLVEGYIALNINPNTSYIELCEDMGVGGGGGGAGTIGTPVVSNNQGGVAGFDPVMAPMQRRKPPVGLDNCEMFDVCPEEMGHFKAAKAWKHLPDSETKTYLQRYQSRNPNGKIALRSIDPDTGKQDIHWVDYSKKSFVEEYELGFLDILNENSIVKDYNDADDKPGESAIATLPDTKEKVGQKNLNTVAGAQYKSMAHFLENHIKTLHNHDNEDDIGIKVGDTTSMVKLANVKAHVANEILTAHNKKLKDKDKHPPVNISFQTKHGIIDASIPHVSATNVPDLTINDEHISDSPITVDAKAARSRWENTGVTSTSIGPSFPSIDDFNTGEPIKNSFIAIHDSEGNVTYTDHSHIPNIKKALSHVYEKSGSRRRPGRFRLIGEVNPRLSDFGQQQAKLNNVTVNQDFSLASGAQKNFASKWAELTGTKFGHNDVYTTSFKK